MARRRFSKWAWALWLGLIFGVAGETLLFVRRQCLQAESMLVDDFRVLAFLEADVPDSRAKVIEEKVRALPGVQEVRYVSRDSALAALQEQSPELLRSVALLGENPLHAGFEIRLAPEMIPRFPDWFESAKAVGELGDIRYKPLQATAILQMQFYHRLLDVVLSLAACLWLLGAAVGFWVAVVRPRTRRAFLTKLLPAGAGGLSTLAGMCVVFLTACPLRSLSPMWVWPTWENHALLVFLGAMGIGFFPKVKSYGDHQQRADREEMLPAPREGEPNGEGGARRDNAPGAARAEHDLARGAQEPCPAPEETSGEEEAKPSSEETIEAEL